MRFKSFVALSALTFATLLLFTAVAGAVGSISGQVKLEHEVALLPVEGAAVGAISADARLGPMARAVDSHFVSMARTDSNGNYRLDNLPAGNYKVVACKEGLGCLFYDGTGGGSPHPDSARLVEVTDEQITSGIDIRFGAFPPFPPKGFITGRITDAETGNGIPNAWVGASGEFLTVIFQTRTGPDGRYFLPVTAGGYFVRAAAHDYMPGAYPGNPVRVEAYDTISGIDIALRPVSPPLTSFIAGRVFDAETGTGVPDAWVGASGEILRIIFETRTGPDGRYFLPVIPGRYNVRAAARGYEEGEYPGNPVTVEAYDTVFGVNIALFQQPISIDFGSISGQVTNAADGSPIPRALVIARQGDGFGFGTALTDENGNYRIFHLRAGLYKVAALARGFFPAVYPDRVEVRAGENTPDINLRLRPVPPPDLGMISGMVTDDSTGEPIGCALVAAVGFDSSFRHRIVRFAHTDSTGNYTIGRLPKIPYFVIAWARGYFAEIYDNVRRFEDATKVTPDASGIDFALARKANIGHSLTGIVQSSANIPLAGAVVQATDGSGAVVGAALSLPDGGFMMEGLASGGYTVSAATDEATASQNIDLYGGSLAGINLSLPSGTGLRGDINGDGKYAPSDVALLLKGVFLGAGGLPDRIAADVNCDGKLTPSDVAVEIQLVFLGRLAGVCGF